MQCICREFFFFVICNSFCCLKCMCISISKSHMSLQEQSKLKLYQSTSLWNLQYRTFWQIRYRLYTLQQHVFTLKWMKSYQRLNFLGILSVFLLLHGYYSIFGCHEFYWITATRFNPCHIVTLFTDRRCCCCTGNHLKLSFIVKLFIPCHHPSGEIPSRVLLSKTGMVSLLEQERKIMKPSQGLWCLCTQKSNVLSVYDV